MLSNLSSAEAPAGYAIKNKQARRLLPCTARFRFLSLSVPTTPSGLRGGDRRRKCWATELKVKEFVSVLSGVVLGSSIQFGQETSLSALAFFSFLQVWSTVEKSKRALFHNFYPIEKWNFILTYFLPKQSNLVIFPPSGEHFRFRSVHAERKFRLECLRSKPFIKRQKIEDWHEHESCCKTMTNSMYYYCCCCCCYYYYYFIWVCLTLHYKQLKRNTPWSRDLGFLSNCFYQFYKSKQAPP